MESKEKNFIVVDYLNLDPTKITYLGARQYSVKVRYNGKELYVRYGDKHPFDIMGKSIGFNMLSKEDPYYRKTEELDAYFTDSLGIGIHMLKEEDNKDGVCARLDFWAWRPGIKFFTEHGCTSLSKLLPEYSNVGLLAHWTSLSFGEFDASLHKHAIFCRVYS